MASIYPIHIPHAIEILEWREEKPPRFPLLERVEAAASGIT
jgi:hypothetical protein